MDDNITKNVQQNVNIYIYVVLIIIIIIIIVIFTYVYYNKNNKINTKIKLERQISTNKYMFDGDFVDTPKDGYNYTIFFWIYIKDFYQDFNKWRHIMHKGTMPNELELDYTKWKNLTGEIQEQSPGIWLHPNKNTIRIAITTELDKEFCNINSIKNTCIDKDYCSWDGLICKPKNEHAYINNETPDYIVSEKQIVEFIDIEDIPIKTMSFLAFSFEQKVINIYLNGKLLKSKKFLGIPVFNKKPMYFNYKNTFNGSIFNFKYIPLSLKSSDIYNNYKNIPNVNYFTKNYRIKTYLKQFNFKELTKTFFK